MLSTTSGFLPFSPVYLSETFDHLPDQYLPSNQEDEEVVLVGGDTKLYAAKVHSFAYVIGLQKSAICYVSGFCTVIPLTDNVVLDGYSALQNIGVTIERPAWTPAMQVSQSRDGTKSNSITIPDDPLLRKKTKQAVKAIQEDSPTNEFITAYLLVIGLDPSCEPERILVSLEDKGSFGLLPESTQFPAQLDGVGLQSAIVGNQKFIRSRKINVSMTPIEWEEAISGVVEDINRGGDSRILLCGAKGVGKSTFLRYSVNRLLSNRPTAKAVCVLDTDLGQPELSVPGTVSLHVLTSPLLSSSGHLHIRTAYRSVFLGDISSRSEPDRFINAVKFLFDAYQRLKATPSTEKRGLMPLLVNTDGFVRYMGAEILSATIANIQPTNILYINSSLPNQRDFSQPLLESIIHTHEANMALRQQLLSETPAQVRRRRKQGRQVPMPPAQTLRVLESAVSQLSRLSAPDLRHLRYFSHFFGGLVLQKDNLYTSFRSQEREDELTKPRRYYIKNATVQDHDDGYFAMRLLQIPPHIVPISCCLFNNTFDDFAVASLLPSINGRLVGISVLQSAEAIASMEPYVQSVQLHNQLNAETPPFSLNYLPNFVAVDCFTVAIVRAIDVVSQSLLLTLPIGCQLPTMDPTVRIVISPATSLSLPPYFLMGGQKVSWPTAPYLTAETTGEGATMLKTRSNLKRKNDGPHGRRKKHFKKNA